MKKVLLCVAVVAMMAAPAMAERTATPLSVTPATMSLNGQRGAGRSTPTWSRPAAT